MNTFLWAFPSDSSNMYYFPHPTPTQEYVRLSVPPPVDSYPVSLGSLNSEEMLKPAVLINQL